MASSTFTDLEGDFLEALTQLHAAAESGDVDQGTKMFRSCSSVLQSLKMEVRCASGSDAELEALRAKLKAHEAALADAKRALDGSASKALMAGGGVGSARGGAAGGAGVAAAGPSADARARSAATTAKLSEGTAQLLATQRVLEETVSVAEGSLGALQEQREKMTAIRGKVSEVSAGADEANSIAKRMSSFWGGMFSSSSASSSK